METTKLREDVPRVEAPLQCRITCSECMKQELAKIDPLFACPRRCTECMAEVLRIT